MVGEREFWTANIDSLSSFNERPLKIYFVLLLVSNRDDKMIIQMIASEHRHFWTLKVD